MLSAMIPFNEQKRTWESNRGPCMVMLCIAKSNRTPSQYLFNGPAMRRSIHDICRMGSEGGFFAKKQKNLLTLRVGCSIIFLVAKIFPTKGFCYDSTKITSSVCHTSTRHAAENRCVLQEEHSAVDRGRMCRHHILHCCARCRVSVLF